MTENGLVGEFCVPDSAGKYPALIILGGSGGGLPSQNASLIASHGYAALALAYFGIPPLPSTLTEIPLEYFKTAIDWLKTQEKVDAEKIGVIGVSRGGELALLLGSKYPDIKAVVSYVGSGVVYSGLGKEDSGMKSAWTYNGEPMPFLSRSHFLYNIDQATIPVEKINGAVLLISGKDDHLSTLANDSEIAFARLTENDHPFPFEHLAYADAGHLIGAPFWPTTTNLAILPSGTRLSLGGTPEGNADANADSWLQLFEFLEANLQNISH